MVPCRAPRAGGADAPAVRPLCRSMAQSPWRGNPAKGMGVGEWGGGAGGEREGERGGEREREKGEGGRERQRQRE